MESKEHNVSYYLYYNNFINFSYIHKESCIYEFSFYILYLSKKSVSVPLTGNGCSYILLKPFVYISRVWDMLCLSYAGFYFVSRTQDYECNKVFIGTSL